MTTQEPDVRKTSVWVVAYVESDIPLGHGETQRQLFVSVMLSFGWKVVLVAFDEQATAHWIASECPQAADRVHIIGYPRVQGGLAPVDRWKVTQALLEAAQRATGWSVNLAFLTWFDAFHPHRKNARACRGVLTIPWAALYFMPSHLRPGTGLTWQKRWKRILTDILLFRQRTCRGVGTLDEGIQASLKWMVGKRSVVVLPEATDNRVVATPLAEEIRIQAGDRPVVGLLGHLAPRKGVCNFLRAAVRVDEGKAFFLMAGEFPWEWYTGDEQVELKQLMQQLLAQGNAHFHLERLDSAPEFNALFELCDVHALVYRAHFQSSGLLAKAAVTEKPVIVAEGHCLHERVQRYQLGLTVPPDDPERLVSAILFLAAEANRRHFVRQGGFAAYRAVNAPHKLEECLWKLCGPRPEDG